jgi:hypothetical protein
LLMLIASRSWLDAFAWFGDDWPVECTIVDPGQKDLGPSFGSIKISIVTKAIVIHMPVLIASRSWGGGSLPVGLWWWKRHYGLKGGCDGWV